MIENKKPHKLDQYCFLCNTFHETAYDCPRNPITADKPNPVEQAAVQGIGEFINLITDMK